MTTVYTPVSRGPVGYGFEDEYRSRNRTFRRHVLRTIAAAPAHPLRFLVTMNQRFSRVPRTLFDAGHVIPVATLRRRGTVLERLAVQRRSANRSAGATPIRSVVDVAGVPVDYDSLREWSRHVPALRGYLTGGRRVRGWNSRTGAVGEVPLVLELPGTVRRADFRSFR